MSIGNIQTQVQTDQASIKMAITILSENQESHMIIMKEFGFIKGLIQMMEWIAVVKIFKKRHKKYQFTRKELELDGIDYIDMRSSMRLVISVTCSKDKYIRQYFLTNTNNIFQMF